MRTIFRLASLLLISAAPALAESGGHDPLPAYAEDVFSLGPIPVTNSMIAIWIVAAVIILVCQIATKKMALIPSGLQNFIEWLVETLIQFFEGILGPHLAKRTFWFFATIFILILFSNWFGLIPGVGTIGWQLSGPGVDPHDSFRPFLRGPNADLNLTMAMSMTFTVLWFYWAISENGIVGFFKHIFAPKGEFHGIMLIVMIPLFLFVGVIEVASIALRPLALMFRLYGNVFAGENILESMLGMKVPALLSWMPPLPFYFLELLVGFVQALVFALLTSVFLKLICDHGDHDEHADKTAPH